MSARTQTNVAVALLGLAAILTPLLRALEALSGARHGARR